MTTQARLGDVLMNAMSEAESEAIEHHRIRSELVELYNKLANKPLLIMNFGGLTNHQIRGLVLHELTKIELHVRETYKDPK